MERQDYLFLFRLGSGEVVQVRHACRSGDAELTARRIARIIGKDRGSDEVICVWMGPAGEPAPARIRKEIQI